MKDDDRPAGRGRHAASVPRRGRRAPLLLALATAVGVWLGVSAPEVSPVSAPVPAVAGFQAAPPPAAGPSR
jgi:hypothetical protein